MNDDVHVIILFDVVEANEPREIRILGEIVRGFKWGNLGGKLVHVCFGERRG